MAIDLDKLSAIINAAQSPSFKKLLEDKGKAQDALDKARAHLQEVEEKLAAAIPPELVALLTPTAPTITRRGRKPGSASKAELKRPNLQELKAILAELPQKTMGVRAEGYDTANIKTLVAANPTLFNYVKGTWPKVTLVK